MKDITRYKRQIIVKELGEKARKKILRFNGKKMEKKEMILYKKLIAQYNGSR